ncbi:MAG: HAD-IA family hydrolase [Thermodesulfovibrionales bacterium]|nr:HAD-IA family hydrolase [Thermodesulfovibrionales bacterium]
MKEIDFRTINTVMLDMDGTMLDKYFDDYFWEHLVPEMYSKKNNIPVNKAKEELFNLYKAHEKTLNWTDIDFWSNELDLDIPALKEQIRHLIEVHPNVEDFLRVMKDMGKRILLVTNAHYKVLDIKLKKTKIGKYFDKCITSFEIGYPKELIRFWQEFQMTVPFEKDKVIFIDDTCDVLKTAKEFGIKNLALKLKASSMKPDKPCPDFFAFEDFGELILIANRYR